VLAALLLQEGGEISAEQLVDHVWGDSAPPTVRTSLQVHISKIRGMLAAHGVSGALTTHGSAYALAIDPGQLDSVVFKDGVARGRDLLGDGHLNEAVAALNAALGLWRGIPLQGLDLPGITPGSLRSLEDLKGLAVSLRAEAQLGLGLHAEALPDLLRARSEFPLNERVCELASLALHRSGRQADALSEIAAIRRELSEQIGMEMSAGLADLERRILSNDETLMPVLEAEVVPRRVRKTVTVLAMRLPSGDPEDVVAATRAVADLFEGAVDNLDGWHPPSSAGRLVGVFGLPAAHEDDAERAVRTADALRRASEALGLDVRLGVSTGEVLVESGKEVRLLTHDPVEVADLLARKCRPGEVLLGLATYRLVGAAVAVDSPQLLVLDDATSPIVARRLLDVSATRTGGRLSAPLIGREGDLQRLRDAAHRAIRTHRPVILNVLGPAGIGKSRLIEAFIAGLGDRVDAAAGRCVPYGRDVGLAPMIDVIRSVAGVTDQPSVVSAQNRLRAFVSDQPESDAVADLLGVLLGIGHGTHTRDETFWAVRRCLEIGAERQPLVVVLEDMQWAEETLVDLVEYIGTTVREVPLVVVCSLRPEIDRRTPNWAGAASEALAVRLDPLSTLDTDALLRALLGCELEPVIRERIVSAAEGNPLFLEEVVSVLIEDGRLVRRGDSWAPTGDLAIVPIPPTVKAVLDARIDLLSASERDVLEAAAIVGREFDLVDLSDLRPTASVEEMGETLDSLCRRGLLDLTHVSSRRATAYAFRHLLIRDVAYQAIPRERRAQDHELLGRAMVDRTGDRQVSGETIGHHLETAFHLSSDRESAADLGSTAARHLATGGRRAHALDDAGAAAKLFERAAACVSNEPLTGAELARLRGAALFDLGRFGEAREVLGDGLAAARASGSRALEWRLQLEVVELDVYTRPDERTASETQVVAEEAIAALNDLGDLGGLARAYRLLGESLTLQGRLDDGIVAFERGADLAREVGDERETALPQRLMALHGTTPLQVFIAQCERLVSARGTRPRPEVLMRLAYARALAGDEPGAIRELGEGLNRARDVGGPFRVADAELYAGLTSLALGDAEGSVRFLEDSAGRLMSIGESNLRSTVEGFLGVALARVGRLDDALAAAQRCRDLASDDDWASQLLWRQVEAQVVAERGRTEEALALIGEAAMIADSTDFIAMAAAVHIESARLFEAANRPADSAREREMAARLAERKGLSERALGVTPDERSESRRR
jgi:tetratricopeptide (TPR) repeat protein/DNA-binding SARP family transcriptional activator